MLDFLGNLVSGVASFFGAKKSADTQEQIAQQNIAEQEAFAKNGIQWKVADAKAAGINPLAALGASTNSFSNVVGPTDSGGALTSAGQSIARALHSTQSADDQAFSEAQKALQLRHGQLENDLLAAQVRLTNQPGNGPATPAAAQTYMGGIPDAHMVVPGTSANEAVAGRWPSPSEQLVQVHPDKVTSGVGSTTAGLHPETAMSRTAAGGFFPQPSQDMSVAMFNPWSQKSWSMRNMVLPTFSDSARPPAFRGDEWSFDPVRGYVHTPVVHRSGPMYYLDRYGWFFK